jgi:hypothetical protein
MPWGTRTSSHERGPDVKPRSPNSREGKHPQPSTPDEQFHFLDLPPELRCIVYEQLDIGACRHILKNTEPWWCYFWKPTDYKSDIEITMVRSYLPVAILTTCRLVNQEAAPLLVRKLRELQKVPIRSFIGYGAAHCITQGRLSECLGRPNRPLWDDPSPRSGASWLAALLTRRILGDYLAKQNPRSTPLSL